ncbi:hypothetical protein YC2023_016806 [Brassica napus]
MSSRRGLILSDGSTWSRSSSITTATTATRDSDYRQDNSKNISYFTSVFKLAKEKASNIKWEHLNIKELTVRPPPPIASFRASSSAINFRSDGRGYFLRIVDGGVALKRQLHHPFDLLISWTHASS